MRLLLLILLFPFFSYSQTAKKYPSLLWKITGNGIKKPSYLYGTMHVSNRVAWYLSEQFFDALKSVDVVGLETHPGEWLDNMEKTGELSAVTQSRNYNSYQTDFYKSTFHQAFPEKRVWQAVISYDPDIINGLLYRQNKNKENFEENTYIDLFIFQAASKLNKQVISLENFAQSEIKARLSAIPDEDEEVSKRNYYNNTQKIEDAYRDGNLDMLDSLSKLASSQNTQKYLIVDRNVFFAETIDSVLHHKTLFSGVGAAHLPGEDGVIEMLRKKGYTVEPVIARVTKKSNATREKLDEMVKPVSFQKQFLPDSTITVDLPGKIYPLVDIGNLKYYIHADMVNGNFYTVVRLQHLAPIFNMNSDAIQNKIDSLLFENIPGKILEKKEITANNGIKGIEVINRTRRGDEQRYQIYFTDIEMILFKLGGKQKYATSKEANQFFNSIKFISKTTNGQTFSPATGGFEIKLPAAFNYHKHQTNSTIGLVEDLYAYDKTARQFTGMQHAIYNDFSYLEQDTFELLRFTKNILTNLNFKDSRKYTFGTEQRLPSIRFYATNEVGTQLDGKIFIKGVHYYYLFQISEKGSPRSLTTFDSFKLTDFNYINPIKTITDRSFLFKAKDEITESAATRFTESYNKAYLALQKKKNDSLKVADDFRSDNKVYYSPSSNEYVNITFEKYSQYDYRNPKELEKKIDQVFTENNSMFLTERKFDFKNNRLQYSCVLKDTATARAIKIQLYFQNGTMHEITAPFDTTIGMRGWTKDFMESFQPIDSAAGPNIFEYKFDKLLSDLTSPDSLKKKTANGALGVISMNKEFADDFLAFVSGKNLTTIPSDTRAQLFVSGGTLKSDKIIPVYKNLYKQYVDSFYLQLCLLKGLAFQKTTGSYAAFSDLLLAETPLVGDEGTIDDVFEVLHDSLQLCRNFFPGMLKLTRYEEYRKPVYTLLAELIHQKIIDPTSIVNQKENILLDANLALKRYNPSVKGSPSGQYSDMERMEAAAYTIAQNIKNNLEGLSGNNSGNIEELNKTNALQRPPLLNYAITLAPFYKTDAQARQFFQKMQKVRDQEVALPLTILLLKYSVVLNDTIVSFYSKNKSTRTYFYSELEKEKLTTYFDKNYLSREKLIESVIYSGRQISSSYSEKEKKNNDSLVLVATLHAKNKYQQGKMYVYKSAKSKSDDVLWSAAFIAESEKEISPKIELINPAFYVDPRKTEKENLDILLDQFAVKYRKRARSAGNY